MLQRYYFFLTLHHFLNIKKALKHKKATNPIFSVEYLAHS